MLDPLAAGRQLNPSVVDKEGQEAFKDLIRKKEQVMELFRSETGRVVINYLLSERVNYVEELVYNKNMTDEDRGLRRGNVQMIDAILNLPQTVNIKLKDE